jgi:quercetin dioxygenase-like cupin family protein
MRTKAWVGTACIAAAAGLGGFGAGVAIGQQPQRTPPTDNRGLGQDVLARIDLGDQLDGMAGYQLRLRRITVEPGGHIGLHDHRGRPVVQYILDGTLHDHREGGVSHERPAGQGSAVDVSTRHWEENRGSAAVVLIAADVFKP